MARRARRGGTVERESVGRTVWEVRLAGAGESQAKRDLSADHAGSVPA